MSEVATSTTEKTESPDVAVDAIELLATGKRNLLVGEFPSAVNNFQEACRLLAAKYGETADECGESYFYYGKALLELVRIESGVLGNALQGVPEEEEEEGETSTATFEKGEEMTGEEHEKMSDEIIDAMTEEKKTESTADADKAKTEDSENDKKEEKEEPKTEDKEAVKAETEGESKTEDKEKKTEDKEESKTEDKEEAKTEDKKEGDKEEAKKEEEKKEGEEEDMEDEEEGGTADEESQEGEGTAEKEEEEEEVTNAQLAWEMLELAKVIFIRQGTKDMVLKGAQAHLKLGELGLETENYEQAIEDFLSCLKLQKEHLDAEDRLLAETYYQLGLAYSFNKQFEQSIENYRSAVKVIESKIGSLNKVIEAKEASGEKGKEPASSDDPVVMARQELDELREILPDIMSKIEDVEDEKKNMDQVLSIAKSSISVEFGFGGASSDEPAQTIAVKKKEDEPAQNITHLVRKKRKPEEDEADESSKKPRQENGAGDAPATNGNGTVANGNGTTENGNGHAESPEKKEIVVKKAEDVGKESKDVPMEEAAPAEATA